MRDFVGARTYRYTGELLLGCEALKTAECSVLKVPGRGNAAMRLCVVSTVRRESVTARRLDNRMTSVQ